MVMYLYLILLLSSVETFALSVTQVVRDSRCKLSYQEFCKVAAENHTVFQSFRNHLMCKLIVENANFQQGKDQADIIKQEYSFLLPYLPLLFSEDEVGAPETHVFFPEIGPCSSSGIRYIRIAGDLHKRFGDISKFNIVEIGGGFGGQCRTLQRIFGFQHYTIIDLWECTRLIKKYLDYFNIKNITTLGSTSFNEEKYDLVISNYAFSEISRDEQLEYIKQILLPATRGYIIYNYMPSVDPFSCNEIAALIKIKHPTVLVEPEYPSTGNQNVLITWDSSK